MTGPMASLTVPFTMTIGNHEFDFDVDNMERIFKMANFPVVCANYNLDATVLKDIVKPYVVLEKYGLRIGVFGLGTQPEGMIQANKCEGVVYEDPIRVSNEIAALLKDEEGCDLVVCLSHLGIQYRNTFFFARQSQFRLYIP